MAFALSYIPATSDLFQDRQGRSKWISCLGLAQICNPLPPVPQSDGITGVCTMANLAHIFHHPHTLPAHIQF